MKAFLLNGAFQNISDVEKNKDEFIILAKSESEYQEKIQDLWANHRKVIRKQAELDFLEGL